MAPNGGPGFPFTNAVSLAVNCEPLKEIDHYWEKLAANGCRHTLQSIVQREASRSSAVG